MLRPLVPLALCTFPIALGVAQDTPVTPETTQPAPSVADQPQPNTPTTAPQTESDLQQRYKTPPTEGLLESTLRYGPVTFRPGVNYSLSYSDNIFGGRPVEPSAEKQDIIHRIRPDFSATVTDRNDELLIPDMGYSPEFVFLHNNSDRNTVNHYGRFSLVKLLPKTSFGLNHQSSSVEDIFAEAASLERQDNHTTVLNIAYELGGRTTLESDTSQRLYSRESGPTAIEWREDLWFNYLWLPKVDVAIGVGGGYATVDPGLDSYFTAEQARLRWYPTEKLTFELRGGLEWRVFIGEGGEDVVAPIAGFHASYDILRGTRLALSFERRARPSIYVANQVAVYNNFSVNLHQELPNNFYADLNGLYSMVDFERASTRAGIVTAYDYHQIQLSVGYKWTRRITSSAFYRRLGRTEGAGYEKFNANEFGLNLGYHF